MASYYGRRERHPKDVERIAELKARVDALERFASDVYDLGQGCTEIDGMAYFDLLEAHGIIAPVYVTEPCGGYCDCAEMDNIPGDCYRCTIKNKDAAAVL